MCGFILAPERYAPRVERALEAMSYRGAEGFSGTSVRGGWVLGHVRLAIQTDATTGQQPFEWGDRSVAFVGEIFARDLLPLTMTEEEVLSETRSSGKEFMRLDGFWSIASIHNSGSAYVLTDHIGTKPVYYWAQEDIFCSEFEAMFALTGRRPDLDEVYLSNCLKFGYDYSGRTPYKGITQVPPGTRMSRHSFTETNSFAPEAYWEWDQVPRPPNNHFEGLKALITKTILWRAMASSKEVGLLLSGGLDSSIIYYTLAKEGLLNQVSVFTVPNEEDTDYIPEGVTVLPTSLPNVDKELQFMQAPLDLGSLSAQVQLADAVARRGIRVCLTGDGADELFGGYRRALTYDSQQSDVFCELPYYHLPRLDRVHMRATTEIRSPFLAPSVMAAALNLPWPARTQKQHLRNAFHGVVPDRILNRQKVALRSGEYAANPLERRQTLVTRFRQLHQLAKDNRDDKTINL